MPSFTLPPVRRAIPLQRSSIAAGRAAIERLFPGWQVEPVGSGTQALALALIAARDRLRRAKPQAIVPAYGCPDLVAACVYAGVHPRLVDVDAAYWGYDTAQLDAALDEDTIAIVAVNLLGAGDDAEMLATCLRGSAVELIQDSAQHVPIGEHDRTSDAIVLSFGRGKPINLIRGGALLTRAAPGRDVRDAVDAAEERLQMRLLRSRPAAMLFNAVTHPLLYGMATRLPGLELGATRYRPLERIQALPASFFGILGPAVEAYLADPMPAMRLWLEELPRWRDWGVRMFEARGGPPGERMLRLVLLADNRAHRDALIAELSACGLGVTSMYGCSLDRVPGVPETVAAQGPFPAAVRLADRLFTLPTHRFVTSAAVEAAARCIERCKGLRAT